MGDTFEIKVNIGTDVLIYRVDDNGRVMVPNSDGWREANNAEVARFWVGTAKLVKHVRDKYLGTPKARGKDVLGRN